jgi:hypothetical protein
MTHRTRSSRRNVVAQLRPDDRAGIIGKKVLDGLRKAWQRAKEQKQDAVARRALTIAILANADRDGGYPARGRAGRISRKLQGTMSERLVRKYLARLSERAASFRQTASTKEAAHAK